MANLFYQVLRPEALQAFLTSLFFPHPTFHLSENHVGFTFKLYAEFMTISHLLCGHPGVSSHLTWSFCSQLAPLQTVQHSSQMTLLNISDLYSRLFNDSPFHPEQKPKSLEWPDPTYFSAIESSDLNSILFILWASFHLRCYPSAWTILFLNRYTGSSPQGRFALKSPEGLLPLQYLFQLSSQQQHIHLL